jgi:hypothetical protein
MTDFRKTRHVLRLITIGLACAGQAFALEVPDGAYLLKESSIVYKAEHPLHAFEGKSSAARGKAVCRKGRCEILVAAPVKSFDSQNSNRDAHMMEIVKGAQFPLVSFQAKDLKVGDVAAEGESQFAGVAHALKFPKISVTQEQDKYRIHAEGSFLLGDHKIEVPSLLGVPMNDRIEVVIDSVFERQP